MEKGAFGSEKDLTEARLGDPGRVSSFTFDSPELPHCSIPHRGNLSVPTRRCNYSSGDDQIVRTPYAHRALSSGVLYRSNLNGPSEAKEEGHSTDFIPQLYSCLERSLSLSQPSLKSPTSSSLMRLMAYVCSRVWLPSGMERGVLSKKHLCGEFTLTVKP